MRPKVTVYVAVTLDGFLAREDGSIDFLSRLRTPEGEDYGYAEHMRAIDALVVGRATYDMVRDFDAWPWERKRVVVLTHRAIDAAHGEETHEGALAPLLERLAADGVKHVYLDGGVAIRQGLAEDVVDELVLSTVPFTIGAGRPLFGGPPGTTAWKLASVHGYASGLVQARWSRAR